MTTIKPPVCNQSNKALFQLFKTISRLGAPNPSLQCHLAILTFLYVHAVMEYSSETYMASVTDKDDILEVANTSKIL